MAELRKGYAERITGLIWGLIVTGAAVAAMYALSGAEIDMINVTIVALVALGGWLVVSALASTRPRKKSADAVLTDPAVTDAVATDAVVTDAVVTEPEEPASPSAVEDKQP